MRNWREIGIVEDRVREMADERAERVFCDGDPGKVFRWGLSTKRKAS